jgi:hypothetical protein
MIQPKDKDTSEMPGGKAAERLREFISERFPGETALPDEDTTKPENSMSKDSEHKTAKKRKDEECPPEE